jgi:hypothetical protein
MLIDLNKTLESTDVELSKVITLINVIDRLDGTLAFSFLLPTASLNAAAISDLPFWSE